MSNITKIESSSCQRYSNALHVSFHQHILNILDSLLVDIRAKLHISEEMLSTYKGLIEQEGELNRKSYARRKALLFRCIRTRTGPSLMPLPKT